MNTLPIGSLAKKSLYAIILLFFVALTPGLMPNSNALAQQNNTLLASNKTIEYSLPALQTSNMGWNTFLGGSSSDEGYSIAVDSSGNIYVAGRSHSTWGANPIRPYSGDYDVFVAKLGNDGQLLWNTFLGGAGSENGLFRIVVDTSSNAYVIGQSTSSWGENIIRGYTGNSDGFVAKVNSNGNLVWNSFLGDSNADAAQGLAIDPSGNIYTTGFSEDVNNIRWAFVAKLDNSGNQSWNYLLGGGQGDAGTAITLDSNNNIFVAGNSNSTWGQPVRRFISASDTFVAMLDTNGAVLWNTFLGDRGIDFAFDISIGTSNNVYVAGDSYDPWGDPIRAFSGGIDTYIARLDGTGNLLWNTFLGGPTSDIGYGFSLDNNGNSYIAGSSGTSWGSPSQPFIGNSDAFFAQVDDHGALLMNTFIGNYGVDIGYDVTLDQSANLYITGRSDITWGCPIESIHGTEDAFVVKMTTGGSTTYCISGSVTDEENKPLQNVIISDGAGITTTTDEYGQYVLMVPKGWTGLLWPSKTYYKFDPVVLPFINVQDNFYHEDFKAMLIDSDGDGLWDEWEVNGVDLNGDGDRDLDFDILDEFGNDVPADPNSPDIYVYVNWLYKLDTNHTHKPSDDALRMVKDAFQRKGIHLHIILGGGVPETSENEVLNRLWLDPGRGVLDPWYYDTTEFQKIRRHYFLLNGALPGRASVFHYALFGHYLARQKLVIPGIGDVEQRPLGDTVTEMSSSAFGLGWLVDRNETRTTDKLSDEQIHTAEAITFMHELGHTLGLGHGGISPEGVIDKINNKPNHLSIMNYSFSLYGLIYDGKAGHIDYSSFDSQDIPVLKESNLNEKNGLASQNNEVNRYGTIWYCGSEERRIFRVNEPINWNCLSDGNETSVTADINNDKQNTDLISRKEWGHLKFRTGTIGIQFNMLPDFPDQVVIDDIDLPAEIILEQPPIKFNQPPTLNSIPDQVVQYSDRLNFKISATDADNQANTLTFSTTSLPGDLVLSNNGDGTANISGNIDVAPGSYLVDVTVTDPDGQSVTKPVNIIVAKEDARTTYSGPFMVSTGCATCTAVNIPLRVTVQDITSVVDDPAYDPYGGTITNATVNFINRNNSNEVLCSSKVILLDITNPTIGTATCNWNVDIGSSFGLDYTIGTVIDGYYTRNSTTDDATVVVSKPTTNFVTGGGFFTNQRSGGMYFGDPGSHTNFGLNIKFTQKLTNLQGRVTILVRQGGHVYQIKSTALNSLVAIPFSNTNTKSGAAELIGKATITDVTNPLIPITVAGSATLDILMKDNGEPGSNDLIGITLWSKDGKLLYSSYWDGQQTIRSNLDRGNISVK